MAIFNKTNPNQVYQRTAVTIIAQGNRFTGDIDVTGELQVDGTMEGNICAEDTMTVGALGQVSGRIRGQLVQIAGRFEGEIWCQDLTIFSGGFVSGKVHCQQMVVEAGGSFLGQRDELLAHADNDYVEQDQSSMLLDPITAD
jgi:cytoskeletal protein CcmA (bactofilin family)